MAKREQKIILSIIIPAYNADDYLSKLLECLDKQITKGVEVIIVDDGSKVPVETDYKWAQVIRQENGGASAARNTGLDNAKGEYIAFIDADDLVADNYIDMIKAKIAEKCDYIYLSWKTIGHGWQATVILRKIDDVFPPDNLCVWNRVYKRSMIGNIRFNTTKLIAEDAEFIRLVETDGYKKGIISEPIYLYRSDTPNSLSKRFAAGELDTRRIVYYFKEVTPDMTYLIEQFKKDNEEAEVILMTEKNQIPELKKYAMVIPPRRVKATTSKGDPCSLINIIQLPEQYQVVIWTSFAQTIGGIETFIYYFCKQMAKYYDILVLYDKMDAAQIDRVSKYVECRKNVTGRVIECNHLIVNRIIDEIPKNIHANTVIQMVHGAKINYATVPQDRDKIVCVSEYVKQTWNNKTKDALVINNIMGLDKPKNAPLLLVTASRLDAPDKGAARMVQLAKLMESQGISYIWLCFANKGISGSVPRGMIFMHPTLDIIKWVQKADYLVQLSDEEAFCYSLVEALEVNTPVIVTELDILDEIGVKDGENGYVVPFDIDDDYDTTKFLKIPEFEYKFDNKKIINQWRKLLGNTKPTRKYNPKEKQRVLITKQYHDVVLDRTLAAGETVEMAPNRAETVVGAGFGRIL